MWFLGIQRRNNMKSNQKKSSKPLIYILPIAIHIVFTVGLFFYLSYLIFTNPSLDIKGLLIRFCIAFAFIFLDYVINKLILSKSKTFPERPQAVHLIDLSFYLPIVLFMTISLLLSLKADIEFRVNPNVQNIVLFTLFYLVIVSAVIERIALIKTSEKRRKSLITESDKEIAKPPEN